ncbi:MAG: hypothetical protein OXI17_00960 [Gammaproteobacteria bacterium]|nr:hypothetical protein [Gammaproteobacteria bacterium]
MSNQPTLRELLELFNRQIDAINDAHRREQEEQREIEEGEGGESGDGP